MARAAGGSLWRPSGSLWRSARLLFHLAAAPELVEMIFQELLHVRFLVIDFMPQHLVAQRAGAAVALQRAFARLQELAQESPRTKLQHGKILSLTASKNHGEGK